ncbi:MAG: hypothetical protein KGR69_04250 [Verrucomicrobia bacterium]|nr:hypothetical protein [Verrucomicrobiota bacterium]
MIRFDRKLVRFMVAGAALLGLPAVALALPLVIDGKPCGDLSKERSESGSVWSIKGCQPLSDLVSGAVPTPTPTPVAGKCGNGIVDAGEVCDKGDTYTCGGKGSSACVNNCTSCNGSTVPTPTPKPTATPGVDPECADGYLPPFGQAGFDGWLGLRKVQIEPGETQTFCAQLNEDLSAFTMMVVDFTGAAQCFYHLAEFIPPTGSGLASKKTSSPAIISTLTFRNWNGTLLPKGTWKLRVSASPDYPNCPMAYQLTAH